MKTIRATINGVFDRAALTRLRQRVAWSGTVGEKERAAEEALSDLASEGLAALDEHPDATAVSILDGKILCVEVEDEE